MHELTAGQMAMYRIDRAGIGQMMLLTASAVLDRTYSDDELQRAANEVIRLNEGVRAIFVENEDGKVYQDFVPYKPREFKVLHFDSKEKMDAWAQIYATTPLKLSIRSEGAGIPAETWRMYKVTPAMIIKGIASSIGPAITRARHGIKVENSCCEIKLVQLPNRSAVIIKMHHVVSDGWTMLLLASQLIQLLEGKTPRAYQYEEYLKNDEAYRQSNRYKKDRAFFDAEYAKLPFIDPQTGQAYRDLVIWKSRPTVLKGTRKTINLDIDDCNRMREYSAANNTSIASLIQTAVGAYVQRRLKRNMFYLGANSINRTGIKERNVSGLFIITLTQLVEMSGDESFAEAVQSMTLSTYSYFRHQKGMDNNNFFITPIALATGFMDASFLNQVTGSDVEITEYFNNCTYGQYFSAMDHGAGKTISINFDYNLQRFSEKKEVDELLGFIVSFLRDGIADDSKKVSDLGIKLSN